MERRNFIKALGSSLLGLLGTSLPFVETRSLASLPTIPLERVVRVHDQNATFWDYSTDYYWNFVNQEVVDLMVDRGIRELTRKTYARDGWRELLASYNLGDRIAIKFNINGYWSQDNHREIDALIEIINSIIMGLLSIGIPESSIYVYDASRNIPAIRYTSRCRYSNVKFVGLDQVTFGQTGDEFERIQFTHPLLREVIKYIPDVLINSQHLINVPLMKSHGMGNTGSFKNHFGSVNMPIDDMHCCMGQLANNALVDIYKNPHILKKTRLIVGDGTFGEFRRGDGGGFPEPWITFQGQSPNCLFFSLDPVAIDSVMLDHIIKEREAQGIVWFPPHEYLHASFFDGLGIHEHQDKNGRYSQIDYINLEIS